MKLKSTHNFVLQRNGAKLFAVGSGASLVSLSRAFLLCGQENIVELTIYTLIFGHYAVIICFDFYLLLFFGLVNC